MHKRKTKNSPRQFFRPVLCTLLAVAFLAQSAFAVNLYVRDEKVNSDVPPVLQNGRTLVPLGVISSLLGADVSWNTAKKQVFVEMDEMTVLLTIDKKTATITAGNKTGEANLDVAPSILQGRTMVPLGFIASYLGSDVRWDPTTKSVLVDCATSFHVQHPSSGETVDDDFEDLDNDFDGDWAIPERELTAAEQKMVAADQKKIQEAFKNSSAAKALKFKKESLRWHYDLTLGDWNAFGLFSLREKFPGEYRLYSYPIDSDQGLDLYFYLNATTGKVYADAHPDDSKVDMENPNRFVILYYEHPSGDLVLASHVYEEDAEIFVLKKLQSLGKLDQKKTYTTSSKEKKPGSYDKIRLVTLSSKILGRNTVVGTYEFDPFSQRISDSKGTVLFEEGLTKDQSLGSVTEKNAVKSTLQILKKLGAPLQKESAYLFEVTPHDGSFYPNGFDIVFRDKNPDAGVSPVVARYIIQSDGGKLAEYDPIFSDWYTIYGTMSPEG